MRFWTAGPVDAYLFDMIYFFDLVDPVATSAFQSIAPAYESDENLVHHSYFLCEAFKLVDSAVREGVKICQQILWTKPGHWLTLDDKICASV